MNALTNVAFIVAAILAFALWRRRGGGDYPALALIVVTAGVGVGSFVFHTVATKGAMLLDVIPIAIFNYGYFLLTLRRFFGLDATVSAFLTLAFAAFSFGVDAVVRGLNGSTAYLPALAAMLVFSILLRVPGDASAGPRNRFAAQGFLAAAGVFFFSLCFRTIDRDICAGFPAGAHFLWHLLNAATLFLLLRTAILAGPVTR